jgi:hypothetical protein
MPKNSLKASPKTSAKAVPKVTTTAPSPQASPPSAGQVHKEFKLDKTSLKVLFGTLELIEDEPSWGKLVDHVITAGVTIIMLIQLRLSKSDWNAQLIESLPSFKLIKKRILLQEPGRTLCALNTLTSCLSFLEETRINDWFTSLIENPIKTTKAIAKPTTENIHKYISGKMAQTLGFIQSCPSSNLSVFGLSADLAINMSLDDAITFCNPLNYTINKEDIIKNIRRLVLVTAGGMTQEKLVFKEPKDVFSKIEQEILSDVFSRDDTIIAATTVGVSGDTEVYSEADLKLYLSPVQRISYAYAAENSNSSVLKALNLIIREKIKTVSDSSGTKSPKASEPT